MVIVTHGWRLEPYQTNGLRCWQLFQGKSTRAARYYDDLGHALRFVAEYELRNGGNEVGDLADALDRYEAVVAGMVADVRKAMGVGE